MMVREAGLRPGVDIHIYASDISTKMLSKARKGEYRETSFRETDAHLRDKYFIEKNQTWRISDELKRDVDFIHLNLLDRSKIALLGVMDVILCRNVIIYFNMNTKCNIIQMFYEKMRPGGHLLLGHSESLINLSTSFELRHLRHDLVYRRPLPGMAPTNPWHLAAEAAVATTEDPGVSE
jgi:chemotaxis protein methyltransferase CheR